MGYFRAGYDVVGCDIRPQPHYPFPFVQADALAPPFDLSGFDLIHASPPCQAYIRGGLQSRDGRHPRLIEPVRKMLVTAAVPFVIENVPGAPLRADVVLCGSMFGLKVRRHRWFELSRPALTMLPPCDHSAPVAGVYGNPHGRAGAWPGMLPSNLTTWSDAMGINWMTAPEIVDAIPPSYTAHIGRLMIWSLEVARIEAAANEAQTLSAADYAVRINLRDGDT
jgi:DNA (cytosine-5)-methyltransferase 1